jgi:hypothetical protein
MSSDPRSTIGGIHPAEKTIAKVGRAIHDEDVAMSKMGVLQSEKPQEPLTFPCFRSEEWMDSIFEKNFKIPARILEGVDLTPEYITLMPNATLFPQKVGGMNLLI